ncbi:RNA-binding protein, putative [Plasmodium ovale curtisi]|uniref:RNA-binding protein, putative n=1 Tax=Plasmodium ovale curtisi TaxID=864141 RepID=A0A1A8W9B5_PLAOA|nr:RNA-binding protein, putative [Plasmodium ovale curtisi]
MPINRNNKGRVGRSGYGGRRGRSEHGGRRGRNEHGGRRGRNERGETRGRSERGELRGHSEHGELGGRSSELIQRGESEKRKERVEDNPFDKHKVFVRNVRENDVDFLSKEFEKLCQSHFFFRNENNLTKSAICHMRSEEEAQALIEKYNNKKVNNSFIRCEYALKKKYKDKKLVSIAYKRSKINYIYSLKIYTTWDLDNVVVLNYVRYIFLLKKKELLRYLDVANGKENSHSEHSRKEDKQSDNEIEIVNVKKEKQFEDIVVNIDKEKKEDEKMNKVFFGDHTSRSAKNAAHARGCANTDINTDVSTDVSTNSSTVVNNDGHRRIHVSESLRYFVYTIEFVSLELAAKFMLFINKTNFETYMRENLPMEKVKEKFLFFHDLCYLHKGNKYVVIKNLNRTCHIENIKKLFKNIDKNVKILIPKKWDKKLGCAFVKFSNSKKAKKALLLNKTKLCGSRITIEENKMFRLLSDWGLCPGEPNEGARKSATGISKAVEAGDGGDGSDGSDGGDGDNGDDGGDGSDGNDNDSDKGEVDHDGEENGRAGKGRTAGTDNQYGARRSGELSDDVSEGKTLFITNIPLDTTNEEIKCYIDENISRNYIYIKTCRNSGNKISVFVKLRRKEEVDNFLKKIGEYNEEDENEKNEQENVIEKFYKVVEKKKKERLKNILLREHGNIEKSGILFFKNNYLMIKRAVSKDSIKEKKNYHLDEKNEKKEKKEKNKMYNNIHLIEDNNVNNDHLWDQILIRNKKLLEKKKELLKNKNFIINPCRIYIRNYPLMLQQNVFRQLVIKYFTPIIMKKHNLKRKEAFLQSNNIIKKMKLIKENVNYTEGNHRIIDKKNICVTENNSKNTICFLDINTHNNAKQLIHLLQNKNVYDLVNEIVYKKKVISERKNKNIMYVDYCIEDLRMIHIKKIKEEKFLNHIKDKFGTIKTNKTIKKEKKKESRGRRQREKRRLLKMKGEPTCETGGIGVNTTHVVERAPQNREQAQEKNSTRMNTHASDRGCTRIKTKLTRKHQNGVDNLKKKEATKTKKQGTAAKSQKGEKKSGAKKTSAKAIKKDEKKDAKKGAKKEGKKEGNKQGKKEGKETVKQKGQKLKKIVSKMKEKRKQRESVCA